MNMVIVVLLFPAGLKVLVVMLFGFVVFSIHACVVMLMLGLQVKWPVIVDGSWFSSNYHQLSPTIINMVKQPKKFMIVDASTPAVMRAKSHDQKMSPRQGQASYKFCLLDVISGHPSNSPHCPSYPMNVYDSNLNAFQTFWPRLNILRLADIR